MTQEEKARAYDEAIERARYWEKNPTVWSSDDICQKLFQELKESESDRIRKEIIAFLTYYHTGQGNSVKYDDGWIAWLENQGKKQQKTLTWKHWKDGIAGNGEGKLIYLIKHGYTYRLSSLLSFECDYIELSELDTLLSEKQGEQKPQRIVSAEAKESMYDKPTWSEEDEYQINTILNELDLKIELCKKVGNKVEEYRYDTQYNWLKSLKDRVQPEQKQEWSEEDEKRVHRISDFIWKNRKGDTDEIYQQEQDVNWLKSLKDRYTWKPSDEQMKRLYDAVEHYQTNGYPATKLKELYEQMQKIYKL